MKKCIKILALLITTTIFLIGCSANEGDDIFDEIVGTVMAEEAENGESATDSENIDAKLNATSELEGELRILTSEHLTHLQLLSNYFMEKHPNVTIEFETIEQIIDVSQQLALTTRLLADPPDILNTAGLVFEKMSMDSLFVDLKPLIDGPGGINREDYFDNVLRAAEIDGGLYNVPLTLDSDTRLLNKRLFDSINVPIEDIRKMTFNEYLEFYLNAVEANPDEEIFVDSNFNVTTLFRFHQVYDINAGEVNADTPEMRELLSLVNSIPTGQLVEFTEQKVLEFITGTFTGGVDVSYLRPTVTYMYHNHAGLMLPGVFFLQDTDDMQFSHPVFVTSQYGDIGFRTVTSPAIMRESGNQELAWEFIRFAMEHPTSLRNSGFYSEVASFPVNRAMFNDHVLRSVGHSHGLMITFRNIEENEDAQIAATERAEGLQYSLDRFTELMEMLNFERRYCEATFNSIIYPDIYLLVTGRQDVYRTLSNIQNRLEIYIEE
ncbi:MAG: ABC transporter substrate-binding protein [Oscillospiraceae bacterium]|nr:ABC transporter substrate-binding protein [Oscillospiraceae bacterium]MCL2279610.1 ABC transporter substrate-binding protein [Oscillospiraceae bacterium]